MAIHEHNEIEAKLAADNVEPQDFLRWMYQQPHIELYKHIISPDEYYECGSSVVRLRGATTDRFELTVKKRKSDGSTRDRLEIDLHFAPGTTPDDVRAFLEATGYKKAFTITKEAHIFWVKLTEAVEASFVIYDVWQNKNRLDYRRFIEVEIEKGSDITPDTAKRHIRSIVKTMQQEFKLGEPLNESLYEIYSGKKYQTV